MAPRYSFEGRVDLGLTGRVRDPLDDEGRRVGKREEPVVDVIGGG